MASTNNDDATQLFNEAVARLEPGKPVVFTNLIRFRSQADYANVPRPADITTVPEPCSGEEAYFTRYFPLYHASARSVFGDEEAAKVQQVLYTGKDLMPLTIARNAGGEEKVREGYWHAVVVTRVVSWEVVGKISESKMYQEQASYHRKAAVEDDVLFVSTSAGAES